MFDFTDLFQWSDWFFIIIIIASTLLAARKGFVQQLLSLAVLVLTLYVAINYNKDIAKALNVMLGDDYIAEEYALIGTLIVLFFILSKFTGAIVSKVTKHGVTKPDRLLAIVFGFIRGVLIVVIFIGLNVFNLFIKSSDWKDTYVVKFLAPVTKYVFDFVPDKYEKIAGDQLKAIDNTDTMQTVKKAFNKSFELNLKTNEDNEKAKKAEAEKAGNRLFKEQGTRKMGVGSGSRSGNEDFLRQQAGTPANTNTDNNQNKN